MRGRFGRTETMQPHEETALDRLSVDELLRTVGAETGLSAEESGQLLAAARQRDAVGAVKAFLLEHAEATLDG